MTHYFCTFLIVLGALFFKELIDNLHEDAYRWAVRRRAKVTAREVADDETHT